MSNIDFMSLWAKKEEKSGRFYWLPLKVHLTDTMNVARWLWNNWLSDSQRQFCTNSIIPADEENASNLVAFLGAVHDIGKATPAFQTKKGFHHSPDLDQILLEKLELAGFTGISSVMLADPQKSHHSVAGEYLLKTEFQVKDDIGSIIGGHHGKPVDDFQSIDFQSAYAANYYQSEDKCADIYRKWKQVQRELVCQALVESGFARVENLPEISQPGQVIFSGLLIMADWIASNSNYFPLIEVDAEEISDVVARYKKGIALWHHNDPIQIHSYPELEKMYLNRFGFEPRNFQEIVYQTVDQIRSPGIIILEAPMGLGKTEAALAATEIIAAKTGSSGLFFGLPTQATSNGMFGRICSWLENITSEYETHQSLRLCHGKAALNDEANKLRTLPTPKDINIDEAENGSVFVNEWFSGRKKTTLDDFVVGTVDGFLLAALKQKHLALRHLGFSKKVIIIDEVHAYDVYMQQYLEESILWMGAYGVPVILVSATLPQERRQELITAYLKGKGVKRREIQFPEEMLRINYPLISYSDGTEVKAQTDFSQTEDKIVSVRRLDEENLLEEIAELLEGGGVAGILVNTVRKAQELGRKCMERFKDDSVFLLHSAFIATDRIKKESDLLGMIGKQGKRPEQKIIIGTQVMEQSLDIDFDVLITDLCPMDLLLQRIGRLHRHRINRPEKHREAVVYVLGMNKQLDFEKGSEQIYGKYFLTRTQYYMPDKIRIPADIPDLVDKVYGNEELELGGELADIYRKSCDQIDIWMKNKSDKAKVYRIKDPARAIRPKKNNLIAWLKNPAYSNSDEAAAAQVRDIIETIEVIAVKRSGSGYGLFGKDEDISERIHEPRIAKELAKQTIRLPNYVIRRKNITETIDTLEEYNLKYLSDWQEQPWLRGALGIIFDENSKFELNGIQIMYDEEFGLREVKSNGKV